MSILCALLLLPAALILDKIFEEPQAVRHPVCWMGKAAGFWERCLRPNRGPAWLGRAAGFLALCCMLACFVLPAMLLVALCSAVHALAGFAAAAVCVWLCLAPHCLARHARAVLAPLHKGSLDLARTKLSMIVGRETGRLDREAVARACVESIAENCTDGVLSTLFWACAGFILGGLELAAGLVVAQRVANTLDAMWGYRNERYLHFGCCAARADDVFNYLPARLSLPCICLASLVVRRTSAAGAWKSGCTFHNAHESPNSAWSEAAFAGALSLRLGGPATYAGTVIAHPWIGTSSSDAGPEDIAAAIDLMLTTTWICALVLSLVMGLAATVC